MDSVDEFEDILKSTTDFPTMKKKNQPLGPVGRRHEENKSKENNFSKENNLSKPNKKLDDFDDLDDDIFNFSINKKKNDNLFGAEEPMESPNLTMMKMIFLAHLK